MWDLDAVGPFRTTPGGCKHILVAVDKFTKWIEVRPVAKVTSEEENIASVCPIGSSPT
jgi:hypothetical protein